MRRAFHRGGETVRRGGALAEVDRERLLGATNIKPPGPLGALWLWASVEPGLWRSFREVRHGHRYRPLCWAEVPVEELRVRREPLLLPRRPEDLVRLYRTDARRAVNPIERFFPLVDGRQDRRVRHTPHFALLDRYRRTGQVDYDNDYTRMIVARARLQGLRRGEEFLRRKVDALVRTFDSIRGRGYLARGYRRYPIVVFEHSIHPPLPGYVPTDWEIFDGHHRAAAVAVLGIPAVRVLVIRSEPVSPFDWTEEIPWDESAWPEHACATGPAS